MISSTHAGRTHEGRTHRVRTTIAVAVFLGASLFAPAIASAAASLVPANASISVDTASPGGNGAYTTLTGPTMTENLAGDIQPGGNVVLTAPANWEFSPTSVTVSTSVAAGAACGIFATSPVTATTSTITTTLSGAPTTGSDRCALSFSGIKVRPTVTTLPNVGTITIGYSGTASIAGLASGATVGTLTAVAGAPILTFSPQPGSSATSGVAFSPQPSVTALDQFGHVRSGDSIVLSIKPGTGTAGATLTCTTNPVTTNGSGVAAFSGCMIDKAGTGYQLRATDTTSVGTGITDSTTIAVSPGTPSKLAFTTQPTRGIVGGIFATQPVVAVQDAAGNTVTTVAPTNVTLTITTNPGSGTLICGGNPVATVAGVATFSVCRIGSVGVGYVLTASATGLTSAVSLPFDVSDRLGFTTQPAGAVASTAFTTQPVVAVQSGLATTSTHDQGTVVQLSLSGGPSGATLTCTANPVTAVNGLASFAGCRIDKVGTYALVASALGLTSATSSSFVVTVGAPVKLGFTSQPSNGTVTQALPTQPVVAIQDAGGNTVTTGVYATSLVSLSILSNPGGGTLTCTSGLSRVAIAGVATFSGCSIDRTGVGYTLLASATGLTPATSNPFTISAPSAQITLATSARVITWAGPVTLTIQFGQNGAYKSFALQGARDGVNFVTVANLSTDASGRATFTWRPVTNLFYRVSFAGTTDLSGGFSNVVRTVVRQIALLRPTNSGAVRSISRNTAVTFTTTVRPARPELPKALVTYVIYRNLGGHWVYFTKRSYYIDSTGRATFTWRFTAAGQWYIRSIANPTPYNANSIWSPVERYNVF